MAATKLCSGGNCGSGVIVVAIFIIVAVLLLMALSCSQAGWRPVAVGRAAATKSPTTMVSGVKTSSMAEFDSTGSKKLATLVLKITRK